MWTERYRASGPASKESLPRAEERALVAAARAGDRRALRRLLDRMSSPIYRFGRGFCRNTEDAEDVMQEVLASIVRSLPSFRGEASLSTWAYTVARRACIRQRRRMARDMVPLDTFSPEAAGDGQVADIPDDRSDPQRELERRELGVALRHAILSLPAAQREVLLLRDVEGLPAREVARVLRVQERAVKSRLHRARLAVRDAMTPLLSGEPRAAARHAGCPDTARLLSRYIEGELDRSRCDALAKHVERCASCNRACRELRRSLAACRRYGSVPVPRAVREAVRRAVHAVLATA